MPMQAILSQRLEMRLKMTAQMIQSIEMLQLPLMALEQQINQQLVENPVLEIEEAEEQEPPEGGEEPEVAEPPGEAEADADAEAADAPEPSAEAAAGEAAPSDAAAPAEEPPEAAFERLEEMERDEEWEQALYTSAPARACSGEEDPKLRAMANTAARPETLQEHVAEQVRLSDAPGRRREIAEVLAYELDDNGYLLVPAAEVFAGREDPPAPVAAEEAEEAMELIRSLDPAGVGARTVEECLLLQLARRAEAAQADPSAVAATRANGSAAKRFRRRRGATAAPRETSFEERLIRDHFDDLLNNRLPKVAQTTGVDIERVKQGIAVIATLNPRPGRDYAASAAQHVMPDVVIEERDGDYAVRMDDSLPRLRISPMYRAMLKAQRRGSAARDYLRDKMQAAKWLIDAIQQRKRTLRRIAEEIVGAQRGFLEHGVSHLKPLLMQDVAAKIGMHVSTVSRAIAEKYMDTPQGLYPMRYFFTPGYSAQSAGGESVSNRAVMRRIEELVKAEDKRKPLSDSAVAKMLEAEGLEVARRTVAKYRERLGVPGSKQRKQY